MPFRARILPDAGKFAFTQLQWRHKILHDCGGADPAFTAGSQSDEVSEMKHKIFAAVLSLSMLLSVFCTAPAFAAASVRSDTTLPFSIQPGASYVFKVTVSGSSAAPSFTVGNGSVLKVFPAGKKGSDYFFKVVAVGAAGNGAGVYTALPGQKPVRQCVVNIGNPNKGVSTATGNGTAAVTTPANVTWLYSLVPSNIATASKDNQYSIYNGNDRVGNLCKNSVKYDFDYWRSDYDESDDAYDPDYATYQIDYSLGGKYKTFSTILPYLSIDTEVTDVEILGDGKTLYKTGITYDTKPLSLNLDVGSVKTLTVSFSKLYGSGGESIIFSGAKLIK
jgi:hypothetical protein